MGTHTRRRIAWDESESEAVIIGVVNAIIEHPEWTVSKMFDEAQRTLPLDRRRIITAFGASPTIHAEIVKRLAAIRDDCARHRAGNNRDYEGELAALRATVAGLSQELADQPVVQPPPDPATIVAAAPTEQLLSILFVRFMGNLSGERTKLEQRLVDQLHADRLIMEERLFKTETMVSAMTNRPGHLPMAPSSSIDDKDYMPIILLAGADRQDFQRIQQALSKASIRLQKVDVSKPVAAVSIGPHDRMIIWMRDMSADYADSLGERVRKAIRIDGTAPDVVAMVNTEAKKVREERRATSNGSS